MKTKRINSRDKGKRGERAWVKELHVNGFNGARRSQQYCGSADSADVIVPSLPSVHHEVKIGNQVPKKIYDFIDQAKNDCGINMPIVAIKRDHCEWLVVMRAEDWCSLIKETDRVKVDVV